MSWAVVGANRETITAVVQTLVTHGFHAVAHQLFHLPATLEHLRQTAYHAIIFLCDGRACSPACSASRSDAGRPACSASRSDAGRPACSASRSDAGRPACCNARHASGAGDCLVRQLRADGNRRPILVIAPRGHNWAGCHEAGAKDYVPAPPDEPLLLARCQTLAEWCRPASETREILRVRDLTLNPATRMVCRGNKQKKLFPREASVLAVLMRNKGKIVSVKRILEEAWDGPDKPGSNVVAKTIERVRDKVDTGFPTRMIENVPGKGYRLSTRPPE